jgi:hypothetical protein
MPHTRRSALLRGDGAIRGSVADLAGRIDACLACLVHANGEYRLQREQDLAIYRAQLERALALTAGAALCENS